MPSRVRNSLSASLVIKSNDQAAVEEAVRRWARHVAERRPEVRRIIWFGSRVNGTPAPGSDVDVCIVLSYSDRRPRDRIGDYLPFGFPVGIDIFPYTEAELERLRSDHSSWYEAINSGVDLMPHLGAPGERTHGGVRA
jgi:predicted nucleotidyltransferase